MSYGLDGKELWRMNKTSMPLASPLAVGARVARAQQGFALASLYTAPANLRSTGDPMYIGGWRVPPWVPRAGRAALWSLLDWRKLEPMARPAVDGACGAAGVARPEGSLFGHWIHSPDGGVTLFPESFCALQPEWPRGLVAGDFPLFRATGDEGLPASLESFLDAGTQPVVVFPGSASGEHGRKLMRDVLMACRALGLRAVALGPAAVEPVPDEDPEWVHRCAHAPLALLLPRCAVFVHHGGIGSCAQGMVARIPQLIRPFAYDQFDNAARIEADGGGRFVPAGRASRAEFLRALDDLAGGGGALRSHVRATGPTGVEAALRAVSDWERAVVPR